MSGAADATGIEHGPATDINHHAIGYGYHAVGELGAAVEVAEVDDNPLWPVATLFHARIACFNAHRRWCCSWRADFDAAAVPGPEARVAELADKTLALSLDAQKLPAVLPAALLLKDSDSRGALTVVRHGAAIAVSAVVTVARALNP